VPLGILGSYGVFTAMANVQIHRFYLPWTWLIISIITVFIVTWVTMRFAVHKLKNQNIIETIRNGSGV
jgi:putative ABC transport system permease protein